MQVFEHPSFPIFVLCAALLVVKMIAVGHVTAAIRIFRKVCLNPEDVPLFLRGAGKAAEAEHPDVARGLRAHRNDLESTLPFLAVGLLYLAIDPSPGSATALIVTFTVARFVFSVCYFLSLQPWRTISFLVGEISLVIMLVQMGAWGYSQLG